MSKTIIPIIKCGGLDELQNGNFDIEIKWLQSIGFKFEEGNFCLIPDESRGIKSVVFCTHKPYEIWSFASLAEKLPDIYDYEIIGLPEEDLNKAALGWLLASYDFVKYKKKKQNFCETQR